MGVLLCHREGCDNIMCDRYSGDFGYICSECFEELEESQTRDVEAFMNTRKKHKSLFPRISYDEIFPYSRSW